MRLKGIGEDRERRRTRLLGLASAASTLGVLLILVGWQTGAAETPEKADRIEVRKAEHTMSLLRDGKVLKSYKVALSTVPVGAKQREGDHKVPEGLYIVDRKNAHSQFHLALHINYPNATDRERARKLGARPGGDIEIHGLGAKFGWVGAAHRQVDWTDGCIAVTNSEIEEIWPLVEVGTVVEIRP
jgi:murein L,D-transpeptidase YafK